MLFVSSKVSQLALLPQGKIEAARRVKNMIAKMDELGFGNCTNTRACEAVCPKNETIANAEGQDCRLRRFTLIIIIERRRNASVALFLLENKQGA